MLAYTVDHSVEAIMAKTGSMRQEGQLVHKRHKSKPQRSAHVIRVILKGFVLFCRFDLCLLWQLTGSGATEALDNSVAERAGLVFDDGFVEG